MRLDDVLRLISGGEGQRVEFKRSLSSDVSHEVVAMANSGGGWILIGVSDDGEIVGSTIDLEKLSTYLQNITPPVKVDIESIGINDKKIFVLRVHDDGRLHSIGGVVYIRIGTVKRPLDLHEISIRLVDTLEAYFDKQVSPVKYRDANEEALRFYFERLAKVRNRDVSRDNWLKYLRSMGAVTHSNGEYYLTYGGILFFYDSPEEYIPYSGVRIVKVGSNGIPFSSKEFHGPVWRIADRIMEYLEGELADLEVVIGPRREKVRRYPMRAVREALINALTHRNYAIPSDILISLHPDRLVVSSPGGLVPGVDLDEPIHIPRNPILSQLMYDTGYIEKYGSGIVLMRRLCREHPLVDLEFISRGYSFKVVFKLSIDKLGLDDIDEKIISILVKHPSSSTELAGEIGLSKQAVIKRLNKLIELGLVKRRGRGWRTQYYI